MAAVISTIVYDVWYWFSPKSYNCEKKLQEVRDNFSPHEQSDLGQNLTKEGFNNRLLMHIGKQEEAEAIDYVAKVFILIKDHPNLINPQITSQNLFDFQAPPAEDSLALKRSYHALSKLLSCNNLTSFFVFIQSQCHLEA